ncbi:hypothetical protein PTKIN_Ptkin13bG0226200 [Pterospermum kingtungense]
MAMEVLYDWLCSKERTVFHENRSGQSDCMLWHPPSAGYVKCNVNSASLDEYRTGFGMVIRDAVGPFLVSKTTLCSDTYTSTKSEALGLAKALLWVHELDMHHVVFETDAKEKALVAVKNLQQLATTEAMVFKDFCKLGDALERMKQQLEDYHSEYVTDVEVLCKEVELIFQAKLGKVVTVPT